MLDFSRANRTHIMALLLVAVMGVFIVRLFYLQVIRHDHYVSLARAEQTRQWELPAERGEIYVMDGQTPRVMVLNETVYTLWVDPSVVKDTDEVATTLEDTIADLLVDDFRSRLEKKDSQYQVLAKNVTYKQAEKIKKERLYGVGFTRDNRRVYPEGDLASQVIGFVNADDEGQYGVEGKLNEQLKGTPGLIKTVADVRDVPLTIGKENTTIPAKNGKNVVLTIDRNVQHRAEMILQKRAEEVGANYASMTVMDPRSGAVLAMANQPSFDPNNLSSIDSFDAVNNRTISRPYEPASVCKTFTTAAGIDTGTITPASTFTNTDYITVDDITITNASKGQTGEITMQHALTWSLNTGTVTLAQRLGGGSINRTARDIMYRYFHDKFRLGEITGIELAGEAKGTVIPPSDPEGNAVRYSNMTFGQGLNVTPLQVAAGFSSVINGGTYIAPTVYAGDMTPAGTFEKTSTTKNASRVIKASTSSTMRDMLVTARNAFYSDKDLKGYAIGGKTGTAQTIENGKYVFSQTEATYIGFGGEKQKEPSYVILVTYAGPGKKFDGQMAIPAFTDMSNWMIGYQKLQPK